LVCNWWCWFFVGQGGSEEVVGYNFFSWCSENVVEERCGPMKNDDDDTATKMVERDDQSKLIKTKMVEREGENKLINIEKCIMRLEKWVKVLFGMVCFFYVLNIFIFTMY